MSPNGLPAWLQGSAPPQVEVLIEVQPDGGDVQQAVEQSIKVIERRLYELGRGTTVKQQGTARIAIRLGPSVDARQAVALATRRGRFEVRLVDAIVAPEDAAAAHPPQQSEVLYGTDGAAYLVEKQAKASGRDVAAADTRVDGVLREPVVSLRFDDDAARRFAAMTAENVGRKLAIVLDGKVLVAPMLREPILDGTVEIAAGFSTEQAMELTMLLRARDELPGHVLLVEQRGPAE